LVCTVNYGQAVRKYSNEFMNIVDDAAAGMANAVTASTSDVNSGYWNPGANAFRRPSIVFDAR
jgi:hypothetical protein